MASKAQTKNKRRVPTSNGFKVKARRHKGDIMSPATRSAVMARIRGRDTGPELAIAAVLSAEGLVFERHARDMPGCPDFLFRRHQVAVFVDGDFWHGWRFPLWRDKLSEKWELKIEGNRRRDTRNFRLLRRRGWCVIRIWEHQIDTDLQMCIARITGAIATRKNSVSVVS